MDEVLHKRIVDIVDEHSGGIKITELVAELIHVIYESHETTIVNNDTFTHLIYSTIKQSSILKILTYTSRKWEREKDFIYTP